MTLPVTNLVFAIVAHMRGANFTGIDASDRTTIFKIEQSEITDAIQKELEAKTLRVEPIQFLASERVLRRWIAQCRPKHNPYGLQ